MRGKNGRFQPSPNSSSSNTGNRKVVAPKRAGAKKKPLDKAVQQRKGLILCFDCGEFGHWAGDNCCASPGSGSFRRDEKSILLSISMVHPVLSKTMKKQHTSRCRRLSMKRFPRASDALLVAVFFQRILRPRHNRITEVVSLTLLVVSVL